MEERLKGYIEFKLDLELCHVSTYGKDYEIRKRYQKYCEEYYKNKSQIIKKNSNKHNK